MIVLAALIVAPVVVALLLLIFRKEGARTALVIAAAALLAVLALVLVAQYFFAPQNFTVPHAEYFGYAALAIDLLCSAYIIWRGVRAGNYLAVFLAGIQCVVVLVYELAFSHGAHVAADLYVDQLSLIMALIIAVIGGGICLYALGYMRAYQAHLEQEGKGAATSGEPARRAAVLELIRDRRATFFAVVFLFLGAMFAVVFSNRLSWLLTAWEVTTVCSFVLIGFSRTEEACRNSFKAVTINLAGGLAFSVALLLLAGESFGIFELDKLIAAGVGGAVVLPLMLIAFAGMTKAAQMPFQGWLLGAMVAPTPVSALLHSSTMVKAGVFILIKLAPALGWNIPGFFVLVVGGLTFLGCSALAISQSNGKRVLAYSTVANLGLIVCCAGVGSPEAVWAAIFLLIFHAAAKALLFCCVGTGEHHLGSRDIEGMDNIFCRMPWLATCMALGMMAMFVAPFGMLVSKWATLVSIAQSGHFELLFILAFGSALTFVFWAKWLGKVLAMGSATVQKPPQKASLYERVTLVGMVVLLMLITLGMPALSEFAVLPYLWDTGELFHLPAWFGASDAVGSDTLLIMSVILLVLLAALVVQLLRKRPATNDTVYLAGVGAPGSERLYYNSFGKEASASQRNWYLTQVFGEESLGRRSSVLLSVIMTLYFIFAVIQEVMLP